MLRLVHPPPDGGQGTRPPKGRHAPALSLTEEERRHLAQALKNLHLRLGSWSCVEEVTGVPQDTLMAAANRKPGAGSGTLAIRVAKAAGVSVEAILSGQLSATDRCDACGARIGAGRAAS